MEWRGQILEWFEIFGPASLAILSFTEAIIQPVPPDLMIVPMVVAKRGDYIKIFLIANIIILFMFTFEIIFVK